MKQINAFITADEKIAILPGFFMIWIIVRLPFDAFPPVYRGQVMSDAPPLDITAIRRIGFMIADRQEGPFRLEIEWINAYT